MEIFYKSFLYFFIYSVLGWIAEMLYCRLFEGKWTNRGFLYGPYCPIYGFGGIIVAFLLKPFSSNPVLIFLLGCILTSLLEYITSYIMEKLFDAKWWDYSNIPLNINGRVCLLNSVLFGILGLFLTYIVHPYTESLISKIPIIHLPHIVFFILIFFIIDIITTLNTILNLKEKLKIIHDIKDQIQIKTNSNVQNIEIIKQLEDLKLKFMNKKETLKNRLINAFPNMDMPKFKESFDELKVAIHNYRTKK